MQSPKDYAADLQRRRQGGEDRSLPRTRSPAASPRRGATTSPGPPRSSVSPLAFLRAMKIAGATGLRRLRPPPVLRLSRPRRRTRRRRPASAALPPTAVTLGNFELLTKELQRLYGNMRIWVTEYGYQTNPPDKLFGVTPAKQALYMQQAWDKLVANPKVDMMIWFLLEDETAGRRRLAVRAVYTASGAQEARRRDDVHSRPRRSRGSALARTTRGARRPLRVDELAVPLDVAALAADRRAARGRPRRRSRPCAASSRRRGRGRPGRARAPRRRPRSGPCRSGRSTARPARRGSGGSPPGPAGRRSR